MTPPRQRVAAPPPPTAWRARRRNGRARQCRRRDREGPDRGRRAGVGVEVPPHSPHTACPMPTIAGVGLVRRAARRRRRPDGGARPGASPPPCSTASRARARPKPISRRSPRRCASGGQVADPAARDRADPCSSWSASKRASAAARPNGIRDVTSTERRAPGAQVAAGRRARRRRRALGAVPALSRPQAHHRRRGTRQRLQAGGRRHLPRARHGGGAGADGRLPHRAGLGDAVAGNLGQRASRAATATCSLPARFGVARHAAVDLIDLRKERPPDAAASSPAAGGGRRAMPWRAASRRCCSSTAAAMRR